MANAKKVSESFITKTELVLPHNTNHIGKLLGGQLMNWIDICAAICASKHSNQICVTASVDRIDFHHSIELGDAVCLVASVNRVFNTSMEIGVKVYGESLKDGKRTHTNTAYLTFVCIDVNGKPIKANEVIPETEDEKRRFAEALQRRENRLKNRTKEY
ncbi:MAG: acyl-CoA thioesterase [Ignavibacteriaceae bacterium]|jgi:acyl-CoA hydrolase